MDLSSALEPGEHLVILLATAVLLASWLGAPRPSPPRSWFVAAGAVAALPVLFGVLPQPLTTLVVGKEGVIEAVTAGALAGVLLHAARHRMPWVGGGAGVLLLEEVDYGFLWASASAPPEFLHGQLNTHNLPVLEAMWRLVPLALVLLLAARGRWSPAWEARLAPLRLPRLQPHVPLGLGTMLVGAVATWALLGEHVADESAELAAVLVVAIGLGASE